MEIQKDDEICEIFRKELGMQNTSKQELFEAKQNLFGFFELLYKIERRLKREQKEKESRDGNNPRNEG